MVASRAMQSAPPGDERMSLSPTVLIVDDEPEVTAAFAAVLAPEGYRVVIASDGLEALRRAEEAQPHIVLLDINLSGWDGLRLLGSLQALAPDASIIIVSGYLDAVTEEIAMDRGAKACLAKPVSATALQHCLADLLTDHARSLELRRLLLALPRHAAPDTDEP